MQYTKEEIAKFNNFQTEDFVRCELARMASLPEGCYDLGRMARLQLLMPEGVVVSRAYLQSILDHAEAPDFTPPPPQPEDAESKSPLPDSGGQDESKSPLHDPGKQDESKSPLHDAGEEDAVKSNKSDSGKQEEKSPLPEPASDKQEEATVKSVEEAAPKSPDSGEKAAPPKSPSGEKSPLPDSPSAEAPTPQESVPLVELLLDLS